MLHLGLLSFVDFVHYVVFQVERNILETGSVSKRKEEPTHSEMSSLRCCTAVFKDITYMYEN